MLMFRDLSENSLRGRIPTELGQVTAMQYLDLSFNKLGGTIPGNIRRKDSALRSMYVSVDLY
jgi:hypothetical protein